MTSDKTKNSKGDPRSLKGDRPTGNFEVLGIAIAIGAALSSGSRYD